MLARCGVMVLAGSLAALRPAPAQSAGGEVLTNQSVVQMVTAKLASDVILVKIQTTKSNFDVTPSGLIALYTSKVPRNVMMAMMVAAPQHPAGEVLTNESVIQMVTAKLPRDVILKKIQSTKSKFDVTSNGLVGLTTNKVPKDLIQAMMVAGS
jgi:hypothetical protein